MKAPLHLTHSNEAGLTLIEILFSLTVLGIVLVALGQGMIFGLRMNTDNKTRVSSLNTCKWMIEKAKSEIQSSRAVFDQANTNNSFNRLFYVDAYGQEVNTTPQSAAAFQVEISVRNGADASGHAFTTVDADGTTHAVTKVLSVKVVAQQNAVLTQASSRVTAFQVEIARPTL